MDSKEKFPSSALKDMDVLCGRGSKVNHHPGNRVFRRLIDAKTDMYRSLDSTKRAYLIKSIVLAVRSEGWRFMKKNKGSGLWTKASREEAMVKTMQALRHNVTNMSSRSREEHTQSASNTTSTQITLPLRQATAIIQETETTSLKAPPSGITAPSLETPHFNEQKQTPMQSATRFKHTAPDDLQRTDLPARMPQECKPQAESTTVPATQSFAYAGSSIGQQTAALAQLCQQYPSARTFVPMQPQGAHPTCQIADAMILAGHNNAILNSINHSLTEQSHLMATSSLQSSQFMEAAHASTMAGTIDTHSGPGMMMSPHTTPWSAHSRHGPHSQTDDEFGTGQEMNQCASTQLLIAYPDQRSSVPMGFQSHMSQQIPGTSNYPGNPQHCLGYASTISQAGGEAMSLGQANPSPVSAFATLLDKQDNLTIAWAHGGGSASNTTTERLLGDTGMHMDEFFDIETVFDSDDGDRGRV